MQEEVLLADELWVLLAVEVALRAALQDEVLLVLQALRAALQDEQVLLAVEAALRAVLQVLLAVEAALRAALRAALQDEQVLLAVEAALTAALQVLLAVEAALGNVLQDELWALLAVLQAYPRAVLQKNQDTPSVLLAALSQGGLVVQKECLQTGYQRSLNLTPDLMVHGLIDVLKNFHDLTAVRRSFHGLSAVLRSFHDLTAVLKNFHILKLALTSYYYFVLWGSKGFLGSPIVLEDQT